MALYHEFSYSWDSLIDFTFGLDSELEILINKFSVEKIITVFIISGLLSVKPVQSTYTWTKIKYGNTMVG